MNQQKVEKVEKTFRVLDFLAAAGTLGYGIYANSMWWEIAGVVGFVLFAIDPSKLMKQFLLRKLTAKK